MLQFRMFHRQSQSTFRRRKSQSNPKSSFSQDFRIRRFQQIIQSEDQEYQELQVSIQLTLTSLRTLEERLLQLVEPIDQLQLETQGRSAQRRRQTKVPDAPVVVSAGSSPSLVTGKPPLPPKLNLAKKPPIPTKLKKKTARTSTIRSATTTTTPTPTTRGSDRKPRPCPCRLCQPDGLPQKPSTQEKQL